MFHVNLVTHGKLKFYWEPEVWKKKTLEAFFLYHGESKSKWSQG